MQYVNIESIIFRGNFLLHKFGIQALEKEKIKLRQQKLIELTSDFCNQKINAEYAELCEKLILKMGRKRDVPFKTGKLEIWAAAAVHVIGTINFLFDKSTNPYISVAGINEFFETKMTTVTSKSRVIRDMLNIGYFDRDFSTQDSLGSNPFNNFVMVDGLIVPMETLPIELQEEVRQARANGHDIEFTTESE